MKKQFELNQQGTDALKRLAHFLYAGGASYKEASDLADSIIRAAAKKGDDASFNQALDEIVSAFIQAPD